MSVLTHVTIAGPRGCGHVVGSRLFRVLLIQLWDLGEGLDRCRGGVVVLDEAGVQEELLVNDSASPVEGVEGVGRVGVVLATSGNLHPGTLGQGGVGGEAAGGGRVRGGVQGTTVAGLGRVALTHG